MRSLLVLFVSALLAGGADVLAQDAPADADLKTLETRVIGFAQLAGDHAWSASPNYAGRLLEYRDGLWRWHMLPPQHEDAKPERLFVVDGSTFLCLWAAEPPLLSRHQASEAPVFTKLTTQLREPRFLACSDGSVLITEMGPQVVRVRPSGQAEYRSIPAKLFRCARPDSEAGEKQLYALVCAVEDQEQRLWFWSYELQSSYPRSYLAGLVTLKDDEFAPMKVTGLQPTDRISAVLAVDDTVYVAKSGIGLFSTELEKMELKELEGTIVRPNYGNPLAYVAQLFRAEGDVYAVAYPPPSKYLDPKLDVLDPDVSAPFHIHVNPADGYGALFRLRGETWQRLIEGFDRMERLVTPDRATFSTPAGIIMESAEGEPWLVPRRTGTAPIRLDWRQDFRVNAAKSFCRQGKHRMLAANGTGDFDAAPVKPPRVPPLLRAGMVVANGPLVRDARGHLFGLHPGERVIERWGEEEVELEVPLEILRLGLYTAAGDDQDRAWFAAGETGVAIFSMAHRSWRWFATWREAFVAQLPRGVRLEGSAFWGTPTPAYSGDGRVAYIDFGDHLQFHENGSWREWKAAEIYGDKKNATISTYFARNGALTLAADDAVWQWRAAAGKWEQSFDPADVKPEPPQPEYHLPEDAQIPDGEETTYQLDELGVIWLMNARGRIFKVVPGRTVEVFAPDEPSPFSYQSYGIGSILYDVSGMVYLMYDDRFDAHRYITIPARHPPAKASATTVRAQDGAIHIRLSVDDATLKRGPSAQIGYTWRLDGGAWSRLSDKPDVKLSGLPRGKHRLEARAFDAELNSALTPAVVEWTVSAAGEK